MGSLAQQTFGSALDETKNLLDTLRQPPYHDSGAIYLSSQSLQWINDKKT